MKLRFGKPGIQIVMLAMEYSGYFGCVFVCILVAVGGTAIAPLPVPSCTHGDKTYEDGFIFKWECNSCQCLAGSVLCTYIECGKCKINVLHLSVI